MCDTVGCRIGLLAGESYRVVGDTEAGGDGDEASDVGVAEGHEAQACHGGYQGDDVDTVRVRSPKTGV